MKWLAVVVSALSAGICEETGFRGYMQRPIEQRHGTPVAILISSLFFMALHLTKAWSTPEMVPIVFGAGVLLGLLACTSGSLIPPSSRPPSSRAFLVGYRKVYSVRWEADVVITSVTQPTVIATEERSKSTTPPELSLTSGCGL